MGYSPAGFDRYDTSIGNCKTSRTPILPARFVLVSNRAQCAGRRREAVNGKATLAQHSICCADIGSVASSNFAWAGLSGDREESSGSMSGFVEFVAHRLKDEERVSLGFECPLWIPIADKPSDLLRARPGEGNHAWSAAAGACSLTAGLAQVTWILQRIRQQSGDVEAFLDWNDFQDSDGGLFIWEALVTGRAKTGSHVSDAKAAVNAFRCALPDPMRRNAVVPKPLTPTRSLIGAALLWAGLTEDIKLLRNSCLVIEVAPRP